LLAVRHPSPARTLTLVTKLHSTAEPPFAALDFLYMPSRNVAADVEHFTTALGAELVFAIEQFDTRVAMVRLSAVGPSILFAGHLEGERPILIYRVDNLELAATRLRASGWHGAHDFEIAHGPGTAFATPTGHRLAICELTRPQATGRLAGRRDF
jgi:hypothetical protein